MPSSQPANLATATGSSHDDRLRQSYYGLKVGIGDEADLRARGQYCYRGRGSEWRNPIRIRLDASGTADQRIRAAGRARAFRGPALSRSTSASALGRSGAVQGACSGPAKAYIQTSLNPISSAAKAARNRGRRRRLLNYMAKAKCYCGATVLRVPERRGRLDREHRSRRFTWGGCHGVFAAALEARSCSMVPW